jgi:GWxTD domain-containing protein
MNRKPIWLLFLAIVSSRNAFAQLSPAYQQWGDTAVRYLMTRQEKIDWAAVKSDADAKTFIEVFWARRDPTPDTPPNELRQQIEGRMAEADKRYAGPGTPGSLTDHGLVYALFGDPSQIVTRVRQLRRTETTMPEFARPINIEDWIYRGDAASRVTGSTSFDIAFTFQDEKHAAEFELDGQSRQSFESVALRIAKAVLKRPLLTAEDLAPKTDSGRTVALSLIVVGDAAVANDVLRRAQEGQNFAELARRFSTHHSAQQGGYLGRIAFADLDPDFRSALSGKGPGASVLIERKPMFAIVKLLTDAEAKDAEAAPK